MASWHKDNCWNWNSWHGKGNWNMYVYLLWRLALIWVCWWVCWGYFIWSSRSWRVWWKWLKIMLRDVALPIAILPADIVWIRRKNVLFRFLWISARSRLHFRIPLTASKPSRLMITDRPKRESHTKIMTRLIANWEKDSAILLFLAWQAFLSSGHMTMWKQILSS